ncbi:DUF5682 family protein [Actinophytocola sp.]|uniref:DUF5682 family protein n=1 Tax=Actinophytocola sp. TaxID=1872138 RepID=UPI002ED035E8
MPATFIGVRHFSPACAHLVQSTIDLLRPAYVLVEGPADLNDRMNELLLAHTLPIAVFTHFRSAEREHMSWMPFCEYSPEWVALAEATRVGAQIRFIDLPAWHPAFEDRVNVYADAEARYADAMERLCQVYAVDNVDTLWDHLFEVTGDTSGLAAYFDVLRGAAAAGPSDTEREAFMAAWVRAAVADAGDRPVVVVTGGFHRPALVTLAQSGDTAWPELPAPPDGATQGSYLVPYSFRRLDAFTGYQSGMPSPAYYQRLWEDGPARAATALMETVVRRLRKRKQRVSTADLIAARTQAEGLARLRGHPHPARTDMLDGLASALVGNALEEPLPWTRRGELVAGTDPVVVEMVAALSGDRVGKLHRHTPLPPLVHDVDAQLDRHDLSGSGPVRLDLTVEVERSRVLHRLRVLRIPGYKRLSGPASGVDPVLHEEWERARTDLQLPALIEAGAHGPTLADAAQAVLLGRLASTDLATTLFDATFCGLADLSMTVLDRLRPKVAEASDLAEFAGVLAIVLGLWRHDRLLGTAGSPLLGSVLEVSVSRILWLAEGIHTGPAPANPARLQTITALRDTLVHYSSATDREAAVAVMRRIANDQTAPPDLRGAAFGLTWSLGDAVEPRPAIRGATTTTTLGDWLAGLFALARDEVLASDDTVLSTLDEVVASFSDHDFLVAVPALRGAFSYFPPKDREAIAERLLARRGLRGSARSLLRLRLEPSELTELARLEAHVDELLAREGLVEGT